MEELARNYVSQARRLSSSGGYLKAFDLYITAFEKYPECKEECLAEFRIVLIRLNELLVIGNKVEDIFLNFGRAMKAFPSNSCLLNDIGKYLYKYGYYTEAWCHFQKAVKLNPTFVNAEKNLNSIKNWLVDRWHFRMLNDKVRNEAYREAIKQTVILHKDTVLDLGSGTGLLSLYVCENEPIAITALDASEVMTKLSDIILCRNKRMEVAIVHKLSTDIVDSRDIGGKRSLMVFELFDSGLIGERVLQVLHHAKETLLSPISRVMPNKAEFFVMGACCDHLRHKYQLSTDIKTMLNIPDLNVHILTFSETYDCEDVHLYKDLKYVTTAGSLFKIDFNDMNDIQDKLKTTEPFTAELTALETSEINIMIGWFNIYLTDQVTITTDPRSDKRANAWQQALFFDNIPKPILKNEQINVEFLTTEGKLTMVPYGKFEVQRVSTETLRFLNDPNYLNMITKCLGMASVYLGQMTEMSQINIVDLCPFPYFGFMMLKRGAQSLTCWARNECDESFFNTVFEANNIPLSKITMLKGQDWGNEAFRDEKYHVVFCNIFDLFGDIDLRMKDIALNLKQTHLVQGGLYMPSSITIVCQLINSHWLEINSYVKDENVSNYIMAEYVNIYQASQVFSIDYSCLEYTPISEPTILGKYEPGITTETFKVPLTKAEKITAILCWYNIELMEELGELATNVCDSFVEGMAFMVNAEKALSVGEEAKVVRCVDADGAYKLMIAPEGQ